MLVSLPTRDHRTNTLSLLAGSIGLRVILVRYSAKADNFYSESSWFIPGDAYYTEQLFISDWVMLASRYAGYAVVGAELWQQPRGTATWGTGASTDWDLAATRAGTGSICNGNGSGRRSAIVNGSCPF